MTLDELLRTHQLVTARWRIIRHGARWACRRVQAAEPACTFATLIEAMSYVSEEAP